MKIIRPIEALLAGQSIFLAGPTPRENLVGEDGKPPVSWRPQFIEELKKQKFCGTVFSPEPEADEWQHEYIDQIDWELEGLNKATVVAFWVPRDLSVLPGFTTNVEFGMLFKNENVFYGRPENTPKTKYLDYIYTKYNGAICNSVPELVEEIIKWIKIHPKDEFIMALEGILSDELKIKWICKNLGISKEELIGWYHGTYIQSKMKINILKCAKKINNG